MENNPYAPPKSNVADAGSDSHGLKRRSVLVMIVFTIVTLGIYLPVWWFRRRPGLNRLNSPKRIALWPLLLLAVLVVIQFVLGFVAGGTPIDEVIGAGPTLLLAVFRLAVAIVMIVQTFRVKDMIEDHASPVEQSGPMFAGRVQLSGLMTFFFSVFYLQWAINRYVVVDRG